MEYSFVPTPSFKKSLKELSKRYASIKEDVERLEKEIAANPQLGTPLGGGFRKIRMEIKSKNKGKRGGARVISYELDVVLVDDKETQRILMVNIYDKSERSTLKDFQYKPIVDEYLKNQK